MSRSTINTNTNTNTNTNIITNINIDINININTNQVQKTLPFRSPRYASCADPDGQTIQERRQTERVYERQIQNEILEINNVTQAISTKGDMVSVLSPPLISQSPSVRLEPKETSVHNNSSPRRLFASASRRSA